MAEHIKAVKELLQPIASDSDRTHLYLLASLHGVVAAMLIGCFCYQRATRKKYSNFWLFRLTNYVGYQALTINIFSLWLPLCSIYASLEMGACIWQLQHWVPGGDQTNFVAVYMLPRIILLYLAWLAAASVIFSGLSVFFLSRQNGGDRLRVHMPNTFFYHGVAFVFPTLILIIFLSLTFAANTHFNKAIEPGRRLLQSLAAGRIDVQAAIVLKKHADISGRLVDAIRYISLAMIVLMLICFQPAAVALVLAIRKSARMRCNSTTSSGSGQSLANTQKILIIYSVYTNLWLGLTVYQLLSLILYQLRGDTSDRAVFISLRLSSYINGIGALTSAVILGGRSFLQTPIDRQGSSQSATTKRDKRPSGPIVPLQLLVTTDTHITSEEHDSTYKGNEKRLSEDSNTLPFV